MKKVSIIPGSIKNTIAVVCDKFHMNIAGTDLQVDSVLRDADGRTVVITECGIDEMLAGYPD